MIAFAMAIDKCEQVPELIDTIYDVYYVCSNEQNGILSAFVKDFSEGLLSSKIEE